MASYRIEWKQSARKELRRLHRNMPTFTAALAQQPDTGLWLYGPEIFRTYCRRHNLRADTASTISVDHIRTLSKELRDARTMVLRLGTGHGSDDARGQTAFALVRHESGSLVPFSPRRA